MNRAARVVGLLIVLGIAAIGAGLAEEAAAPSKPEGIVVKTIVQPNELREYKVVADLKGNVPNPEGGDLVPIDAQFSFKLKHKYIAGTGEGLMPLEISLTEGAVTADGQKLQVTPELYPKLTVLVDKDWRIRDIYGLSGARIAQALPGINYGNMIVLFFLPDGAAPHAVGDKWESVVSIPNYGESYAISNTLKAVETIEGMKCAVIRQEIKRSKLDRAAAAGPAMKATAESAFTLEGGRLVRSRVECEVNFELEKATTDSAAKKSSPNKQDHTPQRANIKIDISPAK